MLCLLCRVKPLKKERNMKRFLTLTLCLGLCVTAFVGCDASKEQRETKKTFKTAVQLLEDGKTQEAYQAFLTIQDNPEAAEYLSHFVFRYARMTTKENSESTESVYEYDQYGRVTKIEKTIDNGIWDPYTEVTLYEYDEKNRVIRYNHASYEYDENNNIIKVTAAGGKTAEFIYDEQGNRIHETYTTAYGEEYMYYSHEYNEHGDVVWTEKNDVFFAGKMTFTYEYQYDQNGRMIQRVSDTVTDKWEYDDLGREIRYERQGDYGYYFIQTTKYDEYGNVAERTTEKPTNLPIYPVDQKVYTYERDYNDFGVILWEKYFEGDYLLCTTNYYDFTIYYNPYGEPEIPEEYLGIGA